MERRWRGYREGVRSVDGPTTLDFDEFVQAFEAAMETLGYPGTRVMFYLYETDEEHEAAMAEAQREYEEQMAALRGR